MKKTLLLILLAFSLLIACSAPGEGSIGTGEKDGADWGDWESYGETRCAPQIMINNYETRAEALSQEYLGIGLLHIADGYTITAVGESNGFYYPVTEPTDHPVGVFAILYDTNSGTMNGLEPAPYELIIGGEVVEVLASYGAPRTVITDDINADAWEDNLVFHIPKTFAGALEYDGLSLNVPVVAAEHLQLPSDCK